MNDKTPYTYDEALTTGSSIGKIITNIWNSQIQVKPIFLIEESIMAKSEFY
jgi:hypothetical protein